VYTVRPISGFGFEGNEEDSASRSLLRVPVNPVNTTSNADSGYDFDGDDDLPAGRSRLQSPHAPRRIKATYTYTGAKRRRIDPLFRQETQESDAENVDPAHAIRETWYADINLLKGELDAIQVLDSIRVDRETYRDRIQRSDNTLVAPAPSGNARRASSSSSSRFCSIYNLDIRTVRDTHATVN